MIELTMVRFGAEDGRGKELDGDGEARRKIAMVDGVCARFRPGLRTVVLVEGRSGWTARLCSSGCDESRRGGEPWPARRTAATLLDLAPSEPRMGIERARTKSFQCDREDKNDLRATRIVGGHDAWRPSPTARRRHGRAQWKRRS